MYFDGFGLKDFRPSAPEFCEVLKFSENITVKHMIDQDWSLYYGACEDI